MDDVESDDDIEVVIALSVLPLLPSCLLWLTSPPRLLLQVFDEADLGEFRRATGAHCMALAFAVNAHAAHAAMRAATRSMCVAVDEQQQQQQQAACVVKWMSISSRLQQHEQQAAGVLQYRLQQAGGVVQWMSSNSSSSRLQWMSSSSSNRLQAATGCRCGAVDEQQQQQQQQAAASAATAAAAACTCGQVDEHHHQQEQQQQPAGVMLCRL
ncbi:hypothetical protein HaLaN_04766 [Haematococcus lacustris]|uniref:Uncharacterized protein n=1 Tax=Haematococcus lacustris TaxID=44745 RepID=A0A699YHA9_HAELA|nr:hypothetical protein HaLaN_04766 [Haematococcus lacustris]